MMTLLTDKATELKPDRFYSVTTCLVLAPHPDDESLGCGGLISLLREEGKEVHVIFITDGSLSHPNSKQYAPHQLADLRKEEALKALAVLQVPETNVFFLNKKDGALPAQGEAEFERNAKQLHLLMHLLQPDLIMVPYEKDPHPDHRATWQMLMYLPKTNDLCYRILEYIIWLHERGEDHDMPAENALRFVNVARWLPIKREAIYKHVSQTTKLINDDANGFILSNKVLQHFITDKEYYLDRGL